MRANIIEKIMGAVEETGIKKYHFVTSNIDNFYNDDRNIVIVDMDTSSISNITKRRVITNGYDGKLMYQVASFDDIHQFKFGGTYKEIKEFVDALGYSLTDDQVKILLELEASETTLIPEQEDYTFRYLTKEQIDRLPDDEKEAYEEELKKHEDELARRGLGQRMSISVQV